MTQCSELGDCFPTFALELSRAPYSFSGTVRRCGRSPQRLQAIEHLTKTVAVNIDCLHFRLAGINPEMVWDDPLVRRRVGHAHLSGGHRVGHLADIAPLDINDVHEFQPWIDLFRALYSERRNADLPPFDGHVSLELEAAPDSSYVVRAFETLKALLME